jgi:hypothetical protein
MTHFKSNSDHGLASFDLTPAYHGQAEKVLRSCKFDRQNNSVTLIDTITDPKDSVRWAIVTSATVEIDGRIATLKNSGKQLRLTREDSHGGDWVVLDAKPASAIENQNKGKRILTFTAPSAKLLRLSVTFDRP